MKNPAILIVDDDPAILRTLGKYFSKEGYTVLAAHNAQEALAALQEKHPGLLIIDVKLPGTSGLELIQEIRRMEIQTPVIVMTAYSNVFTPSDAQAYGIQGYFQKPFDIEEMDSLVSTILTAQ